MERRRVEPLWWVIPPLLRALTHVVFRLRVEGAERIPRTGPVLITANHVSHIDPMVLLVVTHRCGRRGRFLYNASLLRVPVTSFVVRHGHMLPVVRRAGPAALAATARAALDAGELVVIYPEGTVPGPGQTIPGRPGAGLLAQTPGVPVLPVAMVGMERGSSWWPPLRRRAAVVIGAPVAVDADADPSEASVALMAEIRTLLPRARALAGLKPR